MGFGGALDAHYREQEKPDGSAGHANLAREFLSLAGMNIDRLEAAAQGGIHPLPANDYRIEAMRRLVPLVSDDIGEAINDLIEHVTGKGVA
ncbi:hypothetical protein [Guyparkeria halopsychrophila]|uniref:hypothetical protein n=1 Tax=Guyparkeria halopsychrophila TaxID=3139421 RepID=UPI0037C6D3C1